MTATDFARPIKYRGAFDLIDAEIAHYAPLNPQSCPSAGRALDAWRVARVGLLEVAHSAAHTENAVRTCGTSAGQHWTDAHHRA